MCLCEGRRLCWSLRETNLVSNFWQRVYVVPNSMVAFIFSFLRQFSHLSLGHERGVSLSVSSCSCSFRFFPSPYARAHRWVALCVDLMSRIHF